MAAGKAEAEDLGSLLARIDKRQRALGLSDRAVSTLAGLSPSYMRGLRRQFETGAQEDVRRESLAGLSRAMNTSVEWLLTGEGEEESLTDAPLPRPRAPGLEVFGTVAAGNWKDHGFREDPLNADIVPFDPRYHIEHQYALEVRGISINRVADDGDILICLDLGRSRTEARPGDLVVAERKRDGAYELSARRMRITPDGLVLAHDSTDPAFADPKHPQYHAPTRINSPGDEEIRILARVISIYRPL